MVIPKLETNQRLIEFSQTVVGQAGLLGLFAVGLFLMKVPSWIFITIVLLALQFGANYKKWILLLASFSAAIFYMRLDFELISSFASKVHASLPIGFTPYRIVILILVIFTGLLILKPKDRRWPFRSKHPVLALAIFFNLSVLAAISLPLEAHSATFYWSFLLVFGNYFWFFAYALKDQLHHRREFDFFDFSFARAYWSGSYRIPLHTGPQALATNEAHDTQTYTILKIKALKLLYWSFILKHVADLFHYFLFGKFEWLPWDITLPTLAVNKDQLSLSHINQLDWKVWQYWAFMLCTYVLYQMKITYIGNTLISVARMSGFYLYRVSHRPLKARSLADFFRRIHYYYYEVIKTFFFYPTLSRFFKKQRRLRLFFATFIAIFVGGGIQVHFFSHPEVYVGYSLYEALLRWLPAGIYHILFGLFLGFSMVHEIDLQNKNTPLLLEKLRLVVIAVIYIWLLSWIITWGPEWPKASISEHLTYSGRLLGLNL